MTPIGDLYVSAFTQHHREKTMNQKFGLALGFILSLGLGAAQAADHGFYIGAGAGLSMSSTDTAGAIAVTQFFGGTASSTSTDDSDTALRIFAGYNFSKNIGVELNYADLGESSVIVRDYFLNLTDTYEAAVNGFGISLVGSLPISDKFWGFGKIGVFSWKSDLAANLDFGTIGVINATLSEKGTAPMLGVGSVYHFTDNIGIRGEFEHIFIDQEDAGAGDFNVFTVSAVIRF